MTTARTTRHAAAAVVLLLGAALSPQAEAQARIPDTLHAAADTSDVTPQLPQNSVLAGATGGTLGGFVGFAAGALAGAATASGCSEFMCGMGQVMVGATVGNLIGSALGAKAGVRAAGGEPSSTALGAVLGMAAGIGASALVAQVSGDNTTGPMLSFFITQGVVTGLYAAR